MFIKIYIYVYTYCVHMYLYMLVNSLCHEQEVTFDKATLLSVDRKKYSNIAIFTPD